MTTLILTLPLTTAAASTPVEGVLSDDGTSVTRVVQTPLALQPASGAEIVALVPAHKLSWHLLTLPRGTLERGYFGDGGNARLRSVLDGLLEDRLLDETAHMHFALEPGARDGTAVRVAACNRAWLHSWMAALEQASLTVTRIVAEWTPGPDADTPAAMWVTGSPEQPELVCTRFDGVARLPLNATTTALLSATGDNPAAGAVRAEPGVAELAEQALKRPIALQTRAERAVAAAQTGWDLAQFDLLRTRSTRTRKQFSAVTGALLRAPQWRAARWALLALLLANLVGLQAWAWKEQSSQASKRAAIQNVLTTTFPDVRVVVDAPLQMARAVADLQRQSGGTSNADLEAMLGQFQAAAPGTPAPSAIEFVAGELVLRGLDSAAPGLADATTRLQAQGYAARWDGDALVIQQERQP